MTIQEILRSKTKSLRVHSGRTAHPSAKIISVSCLARKLSLKIDVLDEFSGNPFFMIFADQNNFRVIVLLNFYLKCGYTWFAHSSKQIMPQIFERFSEIIELFTNKANSCEILWKQFQWNQRSSFLFTPDLNLGSLENKLFVSWNFKRTLLETLWDF